MKTSVGSILSGFTWTYNGPISIFKGTGYKGKGVSRTMFLTPERIEDIPAELFAVKLSQSTNPALAGKAVFRFFGFKFGEATKFETVAPASITMATPLEEIKAIDGDLILCCASGGRSGSATGFLKSKGVSCENGGGWLDVNSKY